MGGLAYETGKWPDVLWTRHADHSATAGRVLSQGTARQGVAFKGFAEDVHSRLYLHHEPAAREQAPPWATTLHQTMTDTPEYRTLKARCGTNGFLAGIATEAMLTSLLDSGQIPQAEKDDPKQANASNRATMPQIPPAGGNPSPGTPGPEAGDSGDQRRALRRALRHAADAANEAEQAVEGFLGVMGCGTELGERETIESLDQVRQLYDVLRRTPQLKAIAELAGRLQRIARTQKRVKVSPAVGAVKGVTLGNDLERLLPSEVVGLRSTNRYLRLQTLAKIQAGKALQYLMEGEEPVGRGPIILCCDQSGSMHGQRETWAKAIALALLATAAEQKRAFHYIGFNRAVVDEYHVPAGQATLETLLPILMTGAYGGTNFDAPLARAAKVLRDEPTMRKADVIFLTDGLADVSPDVEADYAALKAPSGLSVYAIGVGSDAGLAKLGTIPTARYHLRQFSQSEAEALSPALQAQ